MLGIVRYNLVFRNAECRGNFTNSGMPPRRFYFSNPQWNAGIPSEHAEKKLYCVQRREPMTFFCYCRTVFRRQVMRLPSALKIIIAAGGNGTGTPHFTIGLKSNPNADAREIDAPSGI